MPYDKSIITAIITTYHPTNRETFHTTNYLPINYPFHESKPQSQLTTVESTIIYPNNNTLCSTELSTIFFSLRLAILSTNITANFLTYKRSIIIPY